MWCQHYDSADELFFLVLLVYVYVYTNTTDFLFCLIFHVPPEGRCREGVVTFYVPEDDAIDSRWRLSWSIDAQLGTCRGYHMPQRHCSIQLP